MSGGFGRTSQALARRVASPECHAGHHYDFDGFLANQQDRIRRQLDKAERRVTAARLRSRDAHLGDIEVDVRGQIGSDVSIGEAGHLRAMGIR